MSHALSAPPRIDPADALPGEGRLDAHALDDAVMEINQLVASKGLEVACALGRLLLRRFFAGDITQFRGRERGHVTFRALGRRDDLCVSFTTLWYAVAIVEQLPSLPAEIARLLPVTHHRLLLSVADPALKVQLARRAAEERLSSRALRRQISRARQAETRGSARRRGRPPLPAFAKGVARIEKAIALAHDDPISPESFRNYSTENARELVATLEGQIHRLTTLKKQILTAAQIVDRAAGDR